MKHQLFLLFFVLFLAACGGRENEGSNITPPIAPTHTQTTEIAAASPTSSPVPAITDTTPTPPPELAASPTPGDPPPTDTPASTSTPEPTATPTLTAQLATSINLELVVEGLTSPVALTHAGDDRLFVVEQRGTIQIIQAGQLLAQPFLDIQARVGDDANEQGLLGLAFHPTYAQNGRFFVDYTNNDGHTVISEFRVTANPNQADSTSERILLTINQPYNNHNGGQIAFGPDGYLYIGTGDGGSQGDPHNHGQNLNSLLGKILRLDVDNGEPYAIPPDNPYVAGGGRLEIWHYGLRNPWRFSFDPLTQDLFIADVGQNSFEEINVYAAAAPSGANFGWNIMEGWACYNNANCQTAGLIQPIAVYGRDEGCSVTGGYMYRGTANPALYGNYFFADFCFGTIWGLFPIGGVWNKTTVASQTLMQITSFGEDVNGELYVLDRRGGIYRITE